MDEEFLQIVRNSFPDSDSGRKIRNFILIAEIEDETSYVLNTSVSEAMTPWLMQGMLECAMEQMLEAKHVED